MLNWSHLDGSLAALCKSWAASGEQPYVVIEPLVEDGACAALADFKAVQSQHKKPKQRSHKHVYRKGGTNKWSSMTPAQAEFFREANGERFCRFLEAVTGIEPIYADDALFGGGLHEILPGGYLNVHTDFNHHPDTQKHRRLNLLLYLNPEWDDAWNGHIELWNTALDRPTLKLQPIANRALLFETSESSFHGHPTPLAMPAGRSRRSLATYYYSDFPPHLSPRRMTNYQLTRGQWAELATQVAAFADEAAAIAALETHFQRADIAIAWMFWQTRDREVDAERWLATVRGLAAEMERRSGADVAAAGLPSALVEDVRGRLASLRGGKIVSEPHWELPDGSRTLEAPAGA